MTPSIDYIKLQVCAAFGLRLDELMSRRRSQRYAIPRMIAYYLCRTYTDLSSPEIGRAFNRHHTVIINGAKAIMRLRPYNPHTVAALVCHFHKLKHKHTLHLKAQNANPPRE